MSAVEGLLSGNGVDAITGKPLLAPMTVNELARLATTAPPDRATTTELKARHLQASERVYAPKQGVDPADLAQTGWGVVFAQDADPRIVAALTPLLEQRHAQAAAVEERRYREFVGSSGYRHGESKQEFLRRHHAGPGPVDPDVIPYYLLLVGGPDEIPFEFQYQLDVQHAVGRIHFDDVAGYAYYAANVVAAETRLAPKKPPRLSFFAARNDDDPATALSAEHLVTPLTTALGGDAWQVRSFIGPDATKDGLRVLLSGHERPDLLFTATHGIGFPAGHADQRRTQGALVCQDWPGPAAGRITAEHWFAASDIPETDLTGMIAFLFACFAAGTPRFDEFDRSPGEPKSLAPDPFVAALPQAMLGRDGGALAVVGHVDRALGYSFVWPGAGQQTEVYRSTLAELGLGQPIGSALEYVGDRYAELGTDLRQAVADAKEGWRVDDEMLAGLYAAFADARGFVLLGDPAVRLTTVSALTEDTVTRTAPVTAMSSRPRDREPATDIADEPVTLSPARTDPVEIATYVTDDPDGVSYDPATGRINGARLCLFSSVDLDGTAAHVTSRQVDWQARAEENDDALTTLHARLLEISIAARRAARDESGGSP